MSRDVENGLVLQVCEAIGFAFEAKEPEGRKKADELGVHWDLVCRRGRGWLTRAELPRVLCYESSEETRRMLAQRSAIRRRAKSLKRPRDPLLSMSESAALPTSTPPPASAGAAAPLPPPPTPPVAAVPGDAEKTTALVTVPAPDAVLLQPESLSSPPASASAGAAVAAVGALHEWRREKEPEVANESASKRPKLAETGTKDLAAHLQQAIDASHVEESRLLEAEQAALNARVALSNKRIRVQLLSLALRLFPEKAALVLLEAAPLLTFPL